MRKAYRKMAIPSFQRMAIILLKYESRIAYLNVIKPNECRNTNIAGHRQHVRGQEIHPIEK